TLTPKVDSLQRIDPQTNQLRATIGVGHNPDAVAAGDARLWVGSVEDQSVLRIDPQTNQITGTVGAFGPDSIAVAPGEVLVANTGGTLMRINPSTRAFTLYPNSGYRAVAVGEGAIWTVGPRGLVHANREGGVVTTVPQTGSGSSDVVTGGGAVW